MRPHSSLSIVATLVLIASGCKSTAASANDEVRLLLERQQDAWNSGDVERFFEVGYWASPELTFFSGGERVKGFDAMLERFLARYKAGGAETGKLAFAEVEVVPLGADHAIARGHWFVDFAKGEDVGGLFTLVLEDQRDGWRIVHDHTSVDDRAPAKVQ